MPRFTDLVSSLPSTLPFVGPETQEREAGRQFKARLGANENVFGPSPKAIEAIKNAAEECWMYGDPESFDLRLTLAEMLNVRQENIIVGEGIDGLLGNLVRLFIQPGDKVVTSLGAYPTFNFHVLAFGGEIVTVPYRDDFEDPDALLSMARKVKPKLLYLANPDNPMGTLHSPERLVEFINNVPEETLLVLDEAYIECAPEGSAPPFDPTNANVIRMRTFSKAYALAGLRVGYAIGHEEVIRTFDKIRNHFGVGRASLAGANAALEDQAHLRKTIAKISAARERISQIAAENGLKALPSATNFVAIDCGAGAEKAEKIVDAFLKRDFFIRMPFASPQDRCIRISVGSDENLDLFAELLPQVLAEVG